MTNLAVNFVAEQNLALNLDGHPCREAALFIANFFQDIANKQGNRLHFCLPDALELRCGTVACHGGHAIPLAAMVHEDAYVYKKPYMNGAQAIGHILGFDGVYDYLSWAIQHPCCWGNAHGHEMFSSWGHLAFGKKFDEADFDDAKNESNTCTLQTIADHYRDMALNRLEPSDNGWRIA